MVLVCSTVLACSTLNAGDREVVVPSAIPHLAGQTGVAARSIQWSDLAPQNGKPFIDPFTKLTDDQIADLGYVIRVRRMIVEDKISAEGEDAKDAEKLARRLEEQGVDIVWLTAQRARVQQLRNMQVEGASKSIGESLRNQRVSLKGFAIPIKSDQGRIKEFFLVPTYSACSHEDAPPRLQVVFVATEQGIANPGRRTPIRVTGEISANTMSRTIVNAGGPVRVHSAYTMLVPTVEVPQESNPSGVLSQ